MKKNKDVYMNYICPYCWFTLDNCICELFPPYYLIHIDKNIQEHIRILNKKGYYTVYCCEGHNGGSNTYITFADDYLKEIGTPEGFKYDKKRKMITYTYSTRLTKEKIEKLKKEKLALLLEWCKSLPNHNTEN
jgi:predicted DsbA family dithiol-disulfide isomerase